MSTVYATQGWLLSLRPNGNCLSDMIFPLPYFHWAFRRPRKLCILRILLEWAEFNWENPDLKLIRKRLQQARPELKNWRARLERSRPDLDDRLASVWRREEIGQFMASQGACFIIPSLHQSSRERTNTFSGFIFSLCCSLFYGSQTLQRYFWGLLFPKENQKNGAGISKIERMKKGSSCL